MAFAAIALVAAGAVAVSRLGADSPDPGPDPIVAVGMPPPPVGMRWVGYADQVLAVPESWGTDDAACNVPLSDTVYLAFPGDFFCATPAAVPGVSYVRISPITNGPAFTVDSPDLELEQQIQDSQLEVPDGWTTVPWRPHGSPLNMVRELRRAGLDAEVVREYRPGASAGNETTPSSGSPVRLGTTISVVIPVDRPMVIRQAIATPGDVLDVEFPEGTPNGEDYLMSPLSSPRITAPYRLNQDGAFDQLVIPDDVSPGLYRICVDVTPLCDVLTVVG